MAAAQKARDVDRQIRTIETFYEIMLEGARNTIMSGYLASQRSRLARLRVLALSNPPRARVSVAEKRALVEAIRRRDADAAQRLGEEHVWKSAESALAVVQSLESRKDRIKAA
jgi:DNA-binding GntR family transcriptional regulator